MIAGKKILVVEDEALISMSLERLFESWGYQSCESAATGEEAINRAGRDRPDVVLVDINIKGDIDGIEVAKQITSRFHIPIILMSGYPKSEIEKKARIDINVEFLSKPIDANKLRKVIDSVM